MTHWVARAMRLAVVALVTTVASCGGGGGGDDGAPVISNLRLWPPTAVQVTGGTTTVTGTIDFADSGGNVARLRLRVSNGSELTVPVPLPGVHSGTLIGDFSVSVDVVGHYTFEFWLEDDAGQASNHLGGSFDVLVNDVVDGWRTVGSVAGGLSRVIWTGTQFVAVGGSGNIVVSPDGLTWTARNSGTSATLRGVAWSGSRLVAVGDPGTVVTSSDGVNWSAASLPVTWSTELQAVASSGSRVVALGYDPYTPPNSSPSTVVLVSDDGLNWTAGTMPQAYALQSLLWNGSQFVAAGYLDGESPGAAAVLRSTDGLTWTRDPVGPGTEGGPRYDIVSAAANATLVAVGYTTTIASVAGAAWQPVGVGTIGGARAVAWSGAHFMSCSVQCQVSVDGVSWATRDAAMAPPNTGINGLAWGGPGYGRWVAVGSNGLILTAP